MPKSKERKRAEAADRQDRYEHTPTMKKLTTIAHRPGKSARERERLLRTALA